MSRGRQGGGMMAVLSFLCGISGIILALIGAGRADFAVETGSADPGCGLAVAALILLVAAVVFGDLARWKDGQG